MSLSVTRKPSETLFLEFEDSNGEIILIEQTISGVKGNQVRINTKAPKQVNIRRGELKRQAAFDRC